MGKDSTAPPDSFGFHAPTRLLFGPGQLGHLHEQAMPGKRAMLVVSNGKSMRANGYLDRTLEQLRLAGVDTVLFDKVAANPTKQVVEEGASFAREHGAEFIVALGGGSVMGAAKVMALLAPPCRPTACGTTPREAPVATCRSRGPRCRGWPSPPRRAPAPRSTAAG